MTAEDLATARMALGNLWGLDRGLTLAEMGKVLIVGGSRPDQPIRNYEEGKTAIPGPISIAMEALLSGWRPAHLEGIFPGIMPPPRIPEDIEIAKARRIKRAEATRTAMAPAIVIGPVASAPSSRLKKGK